MAYAAVCVVDNFANGVAATELTLAEVEEGQRAHRAELGRVLGRVVPELAGT
jgi:purine nucleoside phosphorylase